MPKVKNMAAKPVDEDEQALREILKGNIKKFRHRRNWSQFVLAARADISTNFLADIEAGNTWVSAQTLAKLAKLAKAFGIAAYELLKPEEAGVNPEQTTATDSQKTLIGCFSQDLAVVLQESVEKAVDHVKKQYEIG
jgi:transcriptional regulator with XRE-family HTH domain